MTCYTGLDVSLRLVSIFIVDEQGQVRHKAKVAAEMDKIISCLRVFSTISRSSGLRWSSRTAASLIPLCSAFFTRRKAKSSIRTRFEPEVVAQSPKLAHGPVSGKGRNTGGIKSLAVDRDIAP